MTPPLQKTTGIPTRGSGQIQRAKTKNRTVPFKTKTPSTKRKGRKERQKQRVKKHKTHNPMNIYKSASNSTLQTVGKLEKLKKSIIHLTKLFHNQQFMAMALERDPWSTLQTVLQ